jgi:hypothetical protein
MIYGRVTDVTDMEAFSASQPSVPPANRRGENYHGHKYKEEEPQKCIEEMDDHVLDDDIVMVDTVPAKFLTPNRVEDGPEIFKRVRFITRWEDSEESRGSLLWSSGTASCWCVAGPARDSMSPILRILVKYIGSNMPPMPKDVAILAGIFFIGANRQDSKPVLVVYANSEKWHQIAAHKARKWLRLNKLKSRLHLVSSTGGLFKSSVDRFLTRKEEKRALERSKSNEEEREESMEERLKRKKQNELIRLQFGPETLRLTTQLKTTLPPEERISIEKRLRVLEYLSLPRY